MHFEINFWRQIWSQVLVILLQLYLLSPISEQMDIYSNWEKVFDLGKEGVKMSG